MTTYLHTASAIASLLLLVACAATTTDVKPKAEASTTAAQNPGCLTQTGSRIAGNCSAPGRSYSKDDIDRTGAETAGDALQLMDPSILIHH
jgi:hypothetical protein